MTSIISKPYAELLEELNQPSLTVADPTHSVIVNWVITLFHLLLSFVEASLGSIHLQFDARIKKLEEEDESSEESDAPAPHPT